MLGSKFRQRCLTLLNEARNDRRKLRGRHAELGSGKLGAVFLQQAGFLGTLACPEHRGRARYSRTLADRGRRSLRPPEAAGATTAAGANVLLGPGISPFARSPVSLDRAFGFVAVAPRIPGAGLPRLRALPRIAVGPRSNAADVLVPHATSSVAASAPVVPLRPGTRRTSARRSLLWRRGLPTQ